MGRKALDKKRKHAPKKKLEWIQQLLPHSTQKGLRAISMDEAARLLNISKATLYAYFKTRQELIELGLAYKLGEIQRFERLLQEESIPYLERYFKGVQHLSTHVADISNIFLADIKQLHPDIWQQIMDFEEYAIGVLREYYVEGIRRGYFHNIHSSILVMTDRFLITALSDPNFLIQHHLTIKSAFEHYFKMKFFGIAKDPSTMKRYLDL